MTNQRFCVQCHAAWRGHQSGCLHCGFHLPVPVCLGCGGTVWLAEGFEAFGGQFIHPEPLCMSAAISAVHPETCTR